MRVVVGFVDSCFPEYKYLTVGTPLSREPRRMSTRIRYCLDLLDRENAGWLFVRVHIFDFDLNKPDKYFILYNAKRSSKCVKIQEVSKDEYYSESFDPGTYFPGVPELLFPTKRSLQTLSNLHCTIRPQKGE